MSSLTIQIPESLHRNIQALAAREGYMLDQFLASAAAEKLASIMTVEHLQKEAALGRREDFDRFLAAVPDCEPDAHDRLP